MKIIATNIRDINKVQISVMEVVSDWARQEDHPIPRKKLISNMEIRGTNQFTVINAIRSLIKKGYIRRAVNMSNTTAYVQLRGL
jgi:hypothetical protein